MKRFLSIFRLASLALMVLLAVFISLRNPQPVAAANTNSTLNFQARLLTSAGAVVADGYYNIRFKIYDGGTAGGPSGTGAANSGTGGTHLWTEQHYDSNGGGAGNDNRVRVTNGYFSVNLGSQTAFSGINWDYELWMTMDIGGTAQTSTPTYDGEMTNSNVRIKLTGVPYAFSAGELNLTSGSNRGKLVFGSVSNDPVLTLPNETGTICSTGSVCTGYGDITGVTAGAGLANGGTTGTVTLDVASANGGIVVNADNIALTLQPSGNDLSATTSSGSGLEILSTGVTLLQGCGDTEILKWNETSDVWACASDAGGSLTLQQAYDSDANGSDTIITLSANDDSLIFRNPASSGSDSAYILTIEQLNTSGTGCGGGVCGGLSIQSAGTGNLLLVTDTTATAKDVLTIADGGATTFKNQTDSATAFQVQQSDATPILVVNSSTMGVGVGTAPASGRLLHVQGAVTSEYAGYFYNTSTANTSDGLFVRVDPSSPAAGNVIFNAQQGSSNVRIQALGDGTVNLGSTASGQSGNSTINIASGSNASHVSAVSIGSSSNASSTVTIESGTGASAIQIGNGATAHGIQIGTGAAVQTVTIGSTNSTSALTLQAGTGNFALSGAAATTYTLGNTTTTGTITLGQSTDTNTINIGNANTADTKTQTINIGAGTGVTTGKSVVTVGSTANASTLALQGGTGSGAVTISTADAGGILIGGTAQTGSITMGRSTAPQTINIAATNTTSAGTQTINIGTNVSSSGALTNNINIGTGLTNGNTTNNINIGTGNQGAGDVNVTIGSLAAQSHNTLIQGGNSATALQLHSAGSGTIGIGNNAVANTIQLGTTSTNTGNTQTINIGNLNAAGTTNVTIGTGSSATAGTVTLQSKGTLALGNSVSTAINITPLSAAGNNVTIGTSDAIATLLILDTKNNAEASATALSTCDSSTAGGLYYNSSLGKFRGCQNGSWVDLISYASVNCYAGAGATYSGCTITDGTDSWTAPSSGIGTVMVITIGGGGGGGGGEGKSNANNKAAGSGGGGGAYAVKTFSVGAGDIALGSTYYVTSGANGGGGSGGNGANGTAGSAGGRSCFSDTTGTCAGTVLVSAYGGGAGGGGTGNNGAGGGGGGGTAAVGGDGVGNGNPGDGGGPNAQVNSAGALLATGCGSPASGTDGCDNSGGGGGGGGFRGNNNSDGGSAEYGGGGGAGSPHSNNDGRPGGSSVYGGGAGGSGGGSSTTTRGNGGAGGASCSGANAGGGGAAGTAANGSAGTDGTAGTSKCAGYGGGGGAGHPSGTGGAGGKGGLCGGGGGGGGAGTSIGGAGGDGGDGCVWVISW